MSLIEKALEKAKDTVADHGEDWVEKAADRADELLRENLPTLADEGRKLTDAVRENAPALAGAGAAAVGLISSHLLAGEVDEARLLYLRTLATRQERSAARLGAGTAMGQLAAERGRAWDAFLRALERIGKVALKVGLPFLMAALPL